ncbi:MAG: OmpA family protein, partial [Desulfuromonadales bacterium]|nr:OmpA family protein [Desulfuromonadales bacterium]
AEQLAAEQLAAEQLAAEQLAAEQLAAEQLAAEQLAAEQLAAEQLAAEQLAAESLQKASVVRQVEATPGRVVIESDGLIETFQYFTLTDPPRLVVDIYNLEPSFDERTFYAINGFNKIRLGTHANKVRVVFDASELTLPEYKVENRPEGIVVSWDEPESTLIAETLAVVIDNSESEQAEAEKLAAAKLAAEQAETDKVVAAKLAAEQAEADKVAAAKLAAEQAEADKVAAAKLAAEQAEADKVAAAKLAAEQAEADKVAAAKLAAEQAEADKVAAAAEEEGKQEIHLAPRFPSFDATLQASDLAMLKQLAEQLKSQKLARVDVVGHSDNLPIAERSRHIFADNLALSEARARNVVEYLQNQLGVPPEVINLRGLGDSMPMAENSTEAGRALNRRVEVSLITEPVKTTNLQELAKDKDAVQRNEITGLSPAESDIVATN